jgi:hypothetical protein
MKAASEWFFEMDQARLLPCGSRYSAVAMAQLPVSEKRWIGAAEPVKPAVSRSMFTWIKGAAPISKYVGFLYSGVERVLLRHDAPTSHPAWHVGAGPAFPRLATVAPATGSRPDSGESCKSSVMAVTSLRSTQPGAGDSPNDAHRGFDQEQLDRVAFIIGLTTDDADAAKRRRLARKLCELPQDIAFCKSGDAIPRPAQVRDRLARLERACGRPPASAGSNRVTDPQSVFEQVGETAQLLILWQFGLAVSPARPEKGIEDGQAAKALESAFADPAVLQSATQSARRNLERGIVPGRGGNRHKADWPLRQTLLLLATLYFELTGDRPGISTDPFTGKPSGRFLAFLTACLPPHHRLPRKGAAKKRQYSSSGYSRRALALRLFASAAHLAARDGRILMRRNDLTQITPSLCIGQFQTPYVDRARRVVQHAIAEMPDVRQAAEPSDRSDVEHVAVA